RTNVGMIETGNGARFTLESLAELWFLREMLGQDFDGDRAIKPGIASFVHLSHPPGTQRSEDFVGSQSRPGGEGHSWLILSHCATRDVTLSRNTPLISFQPRAASRVGHYPRTTERPESSSWP